MNRLKNLIGLVLLLSTMLVFGQNNKYNLGFEVGPSLISLYGNSMISILKTSAVGGSAGFSFQYNYSNSLSVKTGMTFERKGMAPKTEEIGESGNSIDIVSYRVYFDYITVPILGKITFGEKNNFYINAGTFLGLLIQQTDVKETAVEKLVTDNTAMFNSIDFGIAIGIGIRVPLNDRINVGIELRNNLGIINTSAVGVINNGSIKTNSTGLLFGLTYGLQDLK
jgi:hypothetical protein